MRAIQLSLFCARKTALVVCLASTFGACTRSQNKTSDGPAPTPTAQNSQMTAAQVEVKIQAGTSTTTGVISSTGTATATDSFVVIEAQPFVPTTDTKVSTEEIASRPPVSFPAETLGDVDSGLGAKSAQGTNVEVQWSCLGKGKTDAGFSPQDEYCEWDRASVAKTSATPVHCVYRTSFDMTRKYFLTSRSGTASFSETQFNSYSFLMGGYDPFVGVTRRGLVPHCFERDCSVPYPDSSSAYHCIANSRASDPAVCRTLRDFKVKQCTISGVESPKQNARTPASNQVGDTAFKLLLGISPNVRSACSYVTDPNSHAAAPDKTLVSCDFVPAKHGYASCDAGAEAISVRAVFLVKECKL